MNLKKPIQFLIGLRFFGKSPIHLLPCSWNINKKMNVLLAEKAEGHCVLLNVDLGILGENWLYELFKGSLSAEYLGILRILSLIINFLVLVCVGMNIWSLNRQDVGA